MTKVRLNILPLNESNFTFKIFRKETEDNDLKEENIHIYQLPVNSNNSERKPYLVSFEPKDGFNEYLTSSYYAIGLTKKFLLKKLRDVLKTRGNNIPWKEIHRFTESQIEFIELGV